jgi:hypothetical protein
VLRIWSAVLEAGAHARHGRPPLHNYQFAHVHVHRRLPTVRIDRSRSSRPVSSTPTHQAPGALSRYRSGTGRVQQACTENAGASHADSSSMRR